MQSSTLKNGGGGFGWGGGGGSRKRGGGPRRARGRRPGLRRPAPTRGGRAARSLACERPNAYTYDTALSCTSGIGLRVTFRGAVIPPHRHPRETFTLRGEHITSRLTCASSRALVEARSSGDLSPWQGPRHARRSDSRHPPLQKRADRPPRTPCSWPPHPASSEARPSRRALQATSGAAARSPRGRAS